MEHKQLVTFTIYLSQKQVIKGLCKWNCYANDSWLHSTCTWEEFRSMCGLYVWPVQKLSDLAS